MRRAYSAADSGKQAGISSEMGSPVEYVAISNIDIYVLNSNEYRAGHDGLYSGEVVEIIASAACINVVVVSKASN